MRSAQTMSKLRRERLSAFKGDGSARGASSSWSKLTTKKAVFGQDNKVMPHSEEDATLMVGHRLTGATDTKANKEELHSDAWVRQRRRRRRKRATDKVDQATREEVRDEPSTSKDNQNEKRFARGRSNDDNQQQRRSQVTTQQQQIGSIKEYGERQPVLIHTDQLNTTSRLLYIYPPTGPPISTDNNNQFKHRHIKLDNTRTFNTSHNNRSNSNKPMEQRRQQRQHWRDHSSQMVAAASELNQTDGSPPLAIISSHRQQVARLEVLNLEVTNSSATLTWALTLVPVNRAASTPGERRRVDQKSSDPPSSRTVLDDDDDDNQQELARDLKTLRSIAKRDTDSVRAGTDFSLADEEEATATSDTDREKRLWIETPNRNQKNTQIEGARYEEPTMTPTPTTTTTELEENGNVDILRNGTSRATDTPTTNSKHTGTRWPRPLIEPNIVQALPASSVGPTRRPPNRTRNKPSQAKANVTSTTIDARLADENHTMRRLTTPPAPPQPAVVQVMKILSGTTTTTTTTTTTSRRPFVNRTTKSSLATLPVRGDISNETAQPIMIETPEGATDSLPLTQPATIRSTNHFGNMEIRLPTTTSKTIQNLPIEGMASVPLNRLPASRSTKPVVEYDKHNSSALNSATFVPSDRPGTFVARSTTTSISLSSNSPVTTTTGKPARSESGLDSSTTSNNQQTLAAIGKHTTTRAGKSVNFERDDGATVVAAATTTTTSTEAPTGYVTSSTSNSTTSKPASQTTQSPVLMTTDLAKDEIRRTIRWQDDGLTSTTNVPTTTSETMLPSTTQGFVELSSPMAPIIFATESRAATNNSETKQSDATPTSTTMTTPTERITKNSATATTTTSQVISMSKNQLVTSESLKRKHEEEAKEEAKEREKSKQDNQTPTVTSVGNYGGASTPSSEQFVLATESQEMEPQSRGSHEPMSSKWLVRLRRFGSNEVDIVKVVVSDLRRLLNDKQHQQQPLQRSISFKNLEPSSGYEICVESASPDQLIWDKFNILNANHFLKCHDVSDVELLTGDNNNNNNNNNNTTSLRDPAGSNSTNSGASSGQESLKRMDLLRGDGQYRQVEDALLSLDSTTKSQLPAPSAGMPDKMKSLCREFFTLTTGDQRVASANLAGVLSPGGKVSPSSSLVGGTEFATAVDHQVAVASEPAPGGQPRRPKSLASQHQGAAGALRSRLELMEIGASGGANESRWEPSTSTFEMFASPGQRPADSTLSGTAVLNNLHSSISNETATTFSLLGGATTTTNRSGTHLLTGIGSTTNKLFGEGTHIVPIVGCVFVLIFLATIANMLLNLLHCDAPPRSRSSSDSAADMLAGGESGAGARLSRHLAGQRDERRRRRRRRQRLTDALGGLGPVNTGVGLSPTQTGNLTSAIRSPGHQMLASAPTLLAGHHAHHHSNQRQLSNSLSGSYYSNASDKSVTSKSRIVVVGKNGEPFGSAAGYFDVPPERHLSSPVGGLVSHSPASPLLRNSPVTRTDRVAPIEANQSTVYMVSSAAVRFPLGPSFEGDEKHNADMVGLARRNYDNFINNIYNADEHTSELLANGQLNSGRHSRSHAGTCSADNHYQHVLVSSTMARTTATATSGTINTGTVPAHAHPIRRGQQQRLRFDKVNPIYNMDGIQQRMGQQLASFGQPSARLSVAAAAAAADDNRQEEEKMDECDRDSLAETTSRESPNSSRSTHSGSSGLDKQKQRFHAQQQQLEHVVSKTGSLVPQPFINVSSEVGPEPEAGQAYTHQNNHQRKQQQQHHHHQHANGEQSTDISMDQLDQQHSVAEFLFGDNLPGPPKSPSGNDIEQIGGWAAATPPPPPPPAPLSRVGSLAPPPPSQQAIEKSFNPVTGNLDKDETHTPPPGNQNPPFRQPLINLQARGGGGSQTSPNETIDKSDFAQRRNELASKLHLAGMTKE